METTANGINVIAYMVENPNFIKKGEYKRTEIDDYKDSVDFLITFCGNTRYEIVFKEPVDLKPSKSIKMDGESIYHNRMYWVTERVLNELKERYTWATDF